MTSRFDQELLDSPDRAFSAATDSVHMRDVMQEFLVHPDDVSSEIIQCAIAFARRSEGRTLLQYIITLRNTVTGEEQEHVVTGASYGIERTRKVWEQEALYAASYLSNETALYAVTYVPDLDIILQVFPFDHRLPALTPLLQRTQTLLVPVLAEHLDLETLHEATWRTEVVRYRGTLRACVRIILTRQQAGDKGTQEQQFFAKVYASDDEAERAWKVQQDIGDALRNLDSGVQIPGSVTYLRPQRILVQEAISGPSLFTLQRQGNVVQARAGATRAAQALAAFHQLDLPALKHRLRMPRVGSMRIERSAHRLRVAQPTLDQLITRVQGNVTRRMERLPDMRDLAVHGDFKPSHVFLTEGREVFVDLDKCALGEPMLDVISMMRRLGNHKGLAETFAHEYFRHVPVAWEERLASHYAAYLFEHAASMERAVRSRQRAPARRGTERVELALQSAMAVLESATPTALLGHLEPAD